MTAQKTLNNALVTRSHDPGTEGVHHQRAEEVSPRRTAQGAVDGSRRDAALPSRCSELAIYRLQEATTDIENDDR